MQSEVGGLEMDFNGRWEEVPFRENTFTINLGNILEHATYGVVKGEYSCFTKLRKFSDLASSENASKSEAASMANFLHFESEVNFAPNSGFCLEQGQLPTASY